MVELGTYLGLQIWNTLEWALLLRRPSCEKAILNFFGRFDLEAEKVLRPSGWYTVGLRLRDNPGEQLLFAVGIFNR
jgi:hypothetical protein